MSTLAHIISLVATPFTYRYIVKGSSNARRGENSSSFVIAILGLVETIENIPEAQHQ